MGSRSEPSAGDRGGQTGSRGAAGTRVDARDFSHSIDLTPATDEPALAAALLALPDGPGVIVYDEPATASAPQTPLLIAMTQSLREHARRRLLAGASENLPDADASPRVNFRAITGRIRAVHVGSPLEAAAIYLKQARELLPESYRVVSERWRAWFVQVDPREQFPQWSKTNLIAGAVAPRSASTPLGENRPTTRGVTLGPFPDKDAAGRFIERIIDAFDLCRFHNLLVLAPNATACAYKEMGRCPAPCDGTEPLESYRDRTLHAIEHGIGAGLAVYIETIQSRMRAHAAAAEFELAAQDKALLDRLALLDAPAFRACRRLDEWRMLIVVPDVNRGFARVLLFDVAGSGEAAILSELCVVPLPSPAGKARADTTSSPSVDPLATVRDALGRTGPATSAAPANRVDAVDTIGLVSRWLFTPATKRVGTPVSIDAHGRFDEAAFLAALRSVAKPPKPRSPAGSTKASASPNAPEPAADALFAPELERLSAPPSPRSPSRKGTMPPR